MNENNPKRRVLVLIPSHPEVFVHKPYNIKGMIDLIDKLSMDAEIELGLKFHPRHSKAKYFEEYIARLKDVQVFFGDDFFELINAFHLTIAMEPSSAVIDCIIKGKPVFYFTDFSITYDDELVYFHQLKYLPTFKFSEFSSLIESIKVESLDKYILDKESREYFCFSPTNSAKQIALSKLAELIIE